MIAVGRQYSACHNGDATEALNETRPAQVACFLCALVLAQESHSLTSHAELSDMQGRVAEIPAGGRGDLPPQLVTGDPGPGGVRKTPAVIHALTAAIRGTYRAGSSVNLFYRHNGATKV